MATTEEKYHRLDKQLYPTGRAFAIPEGGERDKARKGLLASEIRFYDEQMSILYDILPDNDNFTADMATIWEERLGLITNNAVSLADRKAAIIRKMNHPGDIPARQSWDYLEQSLQLAGFDVYVHDNTNGTSIFQVLQPYSQTGQQGDGQQGDFQQGTPLSAFSSLFQQVQQGSIQQGETQQGTFVFSDKIVNHIDWELDQYVDISDWYRVFYIGGQDLGTFANIDANRREEFRQIVLKIKPVNTVAMLLLNYT